MHFRNEDALTMAAPTNPTKTANEARTDESDRRSEGRGEQARGGQQREGGQQQREGEDARAQAERNTDRAAERMAEAGRALADSSAETIRRGASIVRETTERTTNVTNEIVRSLSDQMGRMVDFSSPETQRSMERASEHLRIVARYGTVVAERAQPLMQEIVNYTSQAAQAQINAFGKLQRARSPFDLVAAQGELMRTELELWVRSGRRIGDLLSQMGEQVERLIQDEERLARSQAEEGQSRQSRQDEDRRRG